MSSQAIPIPGPLSVGDIIDRAFRIYRARFRPMVLTALALLVPLAVLTGVLSYLLGEQSATASASTSTELTASLGSIALFVLGWLVQGLAELALTFHALAALRDEPMAPGQAISAARGRIGSWLGNAILRALVIVGLVAGPTLLAVLLAFVAGDSPGVAVGLLCLFAIAMLAVVVVALVLQTRWIVSTPSLVVEHLGATGALGRSWSLTKGKFWRSFGVTLVLGLIGLVVLSVPAYVIQAVAMFATERTTLWSAVGTSFGTVLSSLFVPLSAATYVVLYYDLRVRRENLDLDLRVQQLEAEALPSALDREDTQA